jgi:hypothetical protein
MSSVLVEEHAVNKSILLQPEANCNGDKPQLGTDVPLAVPSPTRGRVEVLFLQFNLWRTP